MAGIAGEQIAALGAQPPIGGTARATTDGTTTARGCTTNFIGFGLGLTSEEPLPQDFNATDDTVILARAVQVDYEPVYTPVVGHPDRETLSWAEPAP